MEGQVVAGLVGGLLAVLYLGTVVSVGFRAVQFRHQPDPGNQAAAFVNLIQSAFPSCSAFSSWASA